MTLSRPRIVLANVLALVVVLLPATPTVAAKAATLKSATSSVVNEGVRVIVPDVGINLPVVQGDGTNVDVNVADQHPATQWPGQGDRSVLYAHDQPGMFASLINSVPGQAVEVVRSDGTVLRYTITQNNPNWPPKDNSILWPIGHEQLVLVTCTGWLSTDPKRVVVAEPVTQDRPSAPYGAIAEVSGVGQATVAWWPSAVAGYTPIQGYNITDNPWGPGIYLSVNAPATSVTVPGITGGVPYTFWVQAYSAMGVSYWSAPTNSIMSAAPPGPPSGVTAAGGDGSALVSWTPPSFTGGAETSQYTITASPATAPLGVRVARVGGLLHQAWVWGLTNGVSYTVTVKASNWTGTGPASAASNPVTPAPAALTPGRFHPLSPARILDTRFPLQYGNSALGQGTAIDVQVTGQGGVPAGAIAVVMNVTVAGPTAPGFLTVWPTGGARPIASNLNFRPGEIVPNLVEVGIGTGGRVSVYNYAGVSDVIFDVAGWVSDPGLAGVDGLFTPISPVRLLDTRLSGGPIGWGQVRELPVTGTVIPAGASAVVLNVTSVNPSQPSYVTVYPSGVQRPVASNLNFTPGQIAPNRVIVKLGAGGLLSLYNNAGSVDLVVDVAGWYTDGLATTTGATFNSLPPTRILDTRPATMINHYPAAPMTPGSTLTLTVAGIGGVPAMSSAKPPRAVVLNATVTGTSAPAYLTIWPHDAAARPLTSDLNWGPGDTRPNLVIAKLAADGTISIYNSDGQTDVILDVAGWYG